MKYTQTQILELAMADAQIYAKANLILARDTVIARAEETSYNNFMAQARLNSAALNMVGVTLFAESGRFSDLSFGQFQSISLQDAYLKFLNKYQHDYMFSNMTAFREVYAQNGPKRMRSRLCKFIKRTIDQKVKL